MKKCIVIVICICVSIITGCSSKSKFNSEDGYPVTIALKRDYSFGGLFLDYGVYVDDEKIGQISNSDYEEYVLNLPPGKHTIYIKYGLRSKKLKFNVDEENIFFKFACKTKNILGIDIWEDYSY